MVVVDLLVIGALFVLGLALTHEGPRTWLLGRGEAFVRRFGRPEHTPEWEIEHAELWLMARRRQLTEDLRRIERLLVTDEAMSATRQLGNRLAHQQLLASLARIPDILPGRDRYTSYERAEVLGHDVAAPSPVLATRGRSVEVLEVGGWRR